MIDHQYWAQLVRVVDGDTVELNVDLGFYVSITISARLLRVDTPERGEEGFEEANATCAALLEEAADAEGWLLIRTERTGKFGRWLVDINGVNHILEAKWPYDRGE